MSTVFLLNTVYKKTAGQQRETISFYVTFQQFCRNIIRIYSINYKIFLDRGLTFPLLDGKMNLVYFFKPKEEQPMEAQDFHLLFKDCMPLFIALGDEVRLTIIETLARAGLYDSKGNEVSASAYGHTPPSIKGMNVKDITENTSLSRPAVSHHLKILKEAGLIGVRKEGTANYYYLTIGDSTKKLCCLGRHMQELLDKSL